MIHRKWSLLTGPVAILGGIVGSVVVANFLFVQNDWLVKTQAKKPETVPPSSE